jgi:glycosyltransferase involved in cell wall biosynthesis
MDSFTRADNQKIALSVVVPSLNEEKNVEKAIRNIFSSAQRCSVSCEVIAINDGSTDNTRNIIESLIQSGLPILLINHDRPKGIGYSFWEGTQHSKGEVVTWMPGDGENDAAEIMIYMDLMQHVDIIVPFIFNREVRSKFRRVLSMVYRSIINISFGLNLNYTNGTVLYRKSVLKTVDLKNFGFFYQAEMLIRLIRNGYLFAEVPCGLSVRTSGSSQAISFKSLRKVVTGYIQTMFEIHFMRSSGRVGIRLDPHSVSAQRKKAWSEIAAKAASPEQGVK